MEVKIDDQENIIIEVADKDDNPLIFVTSNKTTTWQKIGAISPGKEELAVRQYKFERQDYPMLGIDHKHSLITKNLPHTAKAINLLFSKIEKLDKFKRIILVIHDKELFYGGDGEYPTNNKQKLEMKVEEVQSDCADLNPEGDYNEKRQYLICKAFDNCTPHHGELELWSFQHEGSRIYDALKSEKNVYDELIKALTPNYKKKLVDIKFHVLELLLPLHINFIGLSSCVETKRNEYWDKIKKVYFSDAQYKETLKEVCSLINGNGSDNVESISSFAADAGFENNKHWDGLKSLIGKDSNADDFFKSFSKDNLSEVVNAIENFKFSSGENGHMREITGWADWYASITNRFDALIAVCK